MPWTRDAEARYFLRPPSLHDKHYVVTFTAFISHSKNMHYERFMPHDMMGRFCSPMLATFPHDEKYDGWFTHMPSSAFAEYHYIRVKN